MALTDNQINIVKDMRSRLTPRAAWIQGLSAMHRSDDDGCWSVLPTDITANSWCLGGALQASVYSNCNTWPFSYHYDTLEITREIETTVNLPVVTWNDTPCRTHEEVLALLDTIIARNTNVVPVEFTQIDNNELALVS